VQVHNVENIVEIVFEELHMISTIARHHRHGVMALLTVFVILSGESFANGKPFDRIVVFGGSLSDPGNAFVLLSDPAAFNFDQGCDLGTPANVPPYDALDEFLIPDGTYAKGGHHVSNGATWVEQLARGMGLSGTVRPALRSSGTEASNYAVGGARANAYPCRFNLSDQLKAYLNDFPITSDNTLVAIEMGGNDVRDILAGLDPYDTMSGALTNIKNTILTLYGQGARKFLLLNVPGPGYTPAVQMIDALIPGSADLANDVAKVFNLQLKQMQVALNDNLLGIDVRILDLYQLLEDIIDNPQNFDIINTTDACVTPNVPPYSCKKPDTYVFWDGIHPTKTVHGIMAQEAATTLGLE
jgi:phospholipase/lecithinase/hemolysin